MTNYREVWKSYTPAEKRNIAIYIAGIMLYKLGIEFFNGSITSLASDRFIANHTFTRLGAAQGLNQAVQCVGAFLIAPLVQKWPTRSVLSGAILTFGLMTAILLIVDTSTGGKIKPKESHVAIYGSWNPNVIFVVWTVSGIAYGMVELIRRVIPVDILGGHVGKLRRLDATVHVFYEIAGTAGAFASSAAISRFGNNYSFVLSPVFFTMAGIIWAFISALSVPPDGEVSSSIETTPNLPKPRFGYLIQVCQGAVYFAESVWTGTKLVLFHRGFIWLFPSYSLTFYLHRFLENTLAPAFAKRVLGVSAWSQIIVGGSNLGELLGAASVFLLSDYVTTPLPWLRVDAIALNIVWVLPYFSQIAKKDVSWAWITAACFLPVSYGWAAGDVSLAAFIQASLSAGNYDHQGVSYLRAVMAFLYSNYIIFNAVFSSVLGSIIDKDFTKNNNIHSSLQRVGGIQFSVCCGIILLATFIPRGAFAFNPRVIGEIDLHGDDYSIDAVHRQQYPPHNPDHGPMDPGEEMYHQRERQNTDLEQAARNWGHSEGGHPQQWQLRPAGEIGVVDITSSRYEMRDEEENPPSSSHQTHTTPWRASNDISLNRPVTPEDEYVVQWRSSRDVDDWPVGRVMRDESNHIHNNSSWPTGVAI